MSSIPKDNPNLDIPIEGEMSNVAVGEKDSLSLEQIEAEINRRNKEKEDFNKPKKNPNHVDALEIDPTDRAPVEEVELDQRFVGKTEVELIKMYMNLETLHKSHTDELGTLRAETKANKEKAAKSESVNLKEIEKQIFPEMKDWSQEKRQAWFKLFNTHPEQALKQANDELMAPYREREAKISNTTEETKLKELHKNSIVPYVNTEIDALISANPDWWKKYGTRIFEHAYDVFRNKPEVYDKYSKIRSEAINTKDVNETEEEDKVKNQTFVEGGRPQKVITKKKAITLEQLKSADPDTSMAVIQRELIKRGVKVETPQGY